MVALHLGNLPTHDDSDNAWCHSGLLWLCSSADSGGDREPVAAPHPPTCIGCPRAKGPLCHMHEQLSEQPHVNTQRSTEGMGGWRVWSS